MGSFQQHKWKQWQQTIDAWHASKLGVREFCRQQGIEEKRLYYWRRRLPRHLKNTNIGSGSKLPAVKFLPVQVKDAASAIGTYCNNTQAPPKIEVFFGNGALIRISGQLSDDNVAGIMKLAAGASC